MQVEMEHNREFLFTEKDFKYLAQLAGTRAGINLSSSKRELIYGRLARRLRELGLKSYKQYCDRLKDGDEEELTNFINAITTNVTSFFRENHHFEFLGQFPEQSLKNEYFIPGGHSGIKRENGWHRHSCSHAQRFINRLGSCHRTGLRGR